MIALLQRVQQASVETEGKTISRIGQGVLVFLGVERNDATPQVQRMAQRILAYRMFSDEQGKMNLDVTQTSGEILLISQFTLAADTNSGNRPSFTPAAPPEEGRRLFDEFTATLESLYPHVYTGRFGAHMKISLVNDGPVTFWLQVKPND